MHVRRGDFFKTMFCKASITHPHIHAISMPKGGIFQRSTIEKDGKGLPYGDRYKKIRRSGETGFGGFFMGFTPSGRAWR